MFHISLSLKYKYCNCSAPSTQCPFTLEIEKKFCAIPKNRTQKTLVKKLSKDEKKIRFQTE
ncbi:hypothetical protein T01_2522 [Trichinella spiralis]|uniref:Uncharacterized protein n=1 Tax=Trichinella spiralis TaxID=6334 RepID=A0A0V0ZUP2_TRISP|nr:hypothetical protein T01_2522 [Trichinella spiralis]